MSKNATTKPAKPATTPAKKATKSVAKPKASGKDGNGSGRKQSSPAAAPAPRPRRTPANPKKPAISSDKSYKAKPDGNPTVTRGLSARPTKKTPRLTQQNPTVSVPEQPEAPKRPLFRRATVTLTASVELPSAHQVHKEPGEVAKAAPELHKQAAGAGGSPGGTSGATGVPEGSQAAPAGAPTGTAAGTSPAPSTTLDITERKFCFEYVQDSNGTRAYMRATGTTREASAATMAWKWLNREEIRAQIEVELAALQKRAGVSTEEMLRRMWAIATADARELVEHVVECCRYCYGKDGLYQRTDTELRRDRAEFENLGRQRIDGVYVGKRKRKADNDPDAAPEVFQEQGGGGFDPHEPPNPHCSACHGYGVPRAVFKDTRLLSPAAAMLYQGIEETKEGLKVRVIDPMVAWEKIGKHIGFYGVDNRQKGAATDPFTAMLQRISGPAAALPVVEDPPEGDDA